MKKFKNLLFFLLLMLFSSCVSLKQFNEIQDKVRDYALENEKLKKAEMENKAAIAELSSKVEQLDLKNKQLQEELEEALYNLTVQKQKTGALEKERDDLLKQLEVLNTGSSSEIEQLLKDLNAARDDLNTREDKLREAEEQLEARNAKLIELQNILTQKEQAVKALKDKVMDALVGFNNKGLTIQEKNGKVYVSLDEKLLFKTGKWDVDPNGQKALKELAQVLAENPDISVMVEGHTDDVEMRGSGEVKDNWDLSVMRATAVTKILTQNSNVDPRQIIAAGRSEYLPISPDKTAGGRQMNRRTEIILTPKLDELLKIIEMN